MSQTNSCYRQYLSADRDPGSGLQTARAASTRSAVYYRPERQPIDPAERRKAYDAKYYRKKKERNSASPAQKAAGPRRIPKSRVKPGNSGAVPVVFRRPFVHFPTGLDPNQKVSDNWFDWNDKNIEALFPLLDSWCYSTYEIQNLLTSKDVVERKRDRYCDSDFKCSGIIVQDPVVTVTYPWCRHQEDFILLKPKNRQYYNPIEDLKAHLRTVANAIRFHMSPEDSKQCNELEQAIRIALQERNWNQLQASMTKFNNHLQIYAHVPPHVGPALKYKLLEQSYSRLVATNFGELKKYKGGTDYVYGEILPGLVDEITSIAGLTSNSVFVDLGSGVGQIVGQVSLMVGCFSYGIELDKSRAAIGKAMVENIRVRCNKWGAEIGVMEIEVGNMLNSPRVVEILGQADAVFIGNTKFDGCLNFLIQRLLRDNLCKKGAKVFALEPLGVLPTASKACKRTEQPMENFIMRVHTYEGPAFSWSANHPTTSFYMQTAKCDV